MYTGEVIDELMNMVARAEDHAQAMPLAAREVRQQREFASRFLYVPDVQPMMIGVA